MHTELRDIPKTRLAGMLERHWGFRAAALEYLPVGFGSHHWAAADADGSRRFVTVDDLTKSRLGDDPDAAFDALDRAFRTAALLRDHVGLGFVLGPLALRDGSVTHRLHDRYALTVFRYLEGEPVGDGGYAAADDRRRVLGMLGRLHRVTARPRPPLARGLGHAQGRSTGARPLDGPRPRRPRRVGRVPLNRWTLLA